MEGTEASVASRWFGVRAEYEPIRRASIFWWYLRDAGLGMISFGMLGRDFDPKRRCTVVLYRRDNGHGVLTYEYDHASEMTNHALSLALRLTTTQAFDLCRELGLSMEHVVGPGTDDPPEPIEWRELATPHRTP